jgi:hypothetical protein
MFSMLERQLRMLGTASLLTLVVAFSLVDYASASTPQHPPLPDPLKGFALNHACGTAVDSKGDVYVSNTGNDAIGVFDAAGNHLVSISDASKPCGLAVDSKGNLYASDTVTGKVVKYVPSAYPFSGTPSYGPPVTIDASGNARGIAVDSSDDSLYVAEGGYVSSYQPDGTLGINEVQLVNVRKETTGGTFTLTFNGQTTAAIPYNATAATVQSALEALSNISPGDVAVSGGPGATSAFTVVFGGAYAHTNVPPLKANSSLSPNQVNTLTVDASAGTYTVAIRTAKGSGDLVKGSNEVTGLNLAAGAFHVGDTIFAAGVPIATTVTEVGAGTLKLSAAATSSATQLVLEASEKTASIPYSASAKGLEEALEALADIAPADVSVSGGPGGPGGLTPYIISFEGAYGGRLVNIESDPSGLSGTANLATTTSPGGVSVSTITQGWNGRIGEGELTKATGVASYTYKASKNSNKLRYITIADVESDEIRVFAGRLSSGSLEPPSIEPRQAIDGSETPAGELGLASTGAYLGVDPKSGHFYAYDATHKVLNEFEATGRFFTQVASKGFEDAKPTAIAVDRSGGPNDGDLYVSAGSGAGAKLLAFGPLDAPSRATLGEPPARTFAGACGDVVDSKGNLYVAGESVIRVFDPAGKELTHIDDPSKPCYLAVDSKGNLYAADFGDGGVGNQKVVRYVPSVYPPVSGTPYTEASPPIETLDEPRGVAVNPANGHLFVSHASGGVDEYDSAAHESKLLKSNFCGLGGEKLAGIDVYGANGDVYVVVAGGQIDVCDPSGAKVLTGIDGSGSPGGAFGSLIKVSIAVDQANGHVLVGAMEPRGDVEEYEASGAFVASFGSFAGTTVRSDLALDGSDGATNGNLYLAFDEQKPGTPDLWALGPLKYGELPVSVTGTASGLGEGNAIFAGTVDPRGFELLECKFEYVTDAAFKVTGFTDLSSGGSKACDKSPAEIGKGIGPVAVKAEANGLDPKGRYDFRLVARNKFGNGLGDAALFGPPVITEKSAQPISYTEATLRGNLDPSGLETKYRFEYGTTTAYGKSTTLESLPGSAGPTDVEGFLTGLEEGIEYHFKLVAENEDAMVEGEDQVLVTQQRAKLLPCPNAILRLEDNSSRLPDCRAYELVTPADTHGVSPQAAQAEGSPMFNNWLVTSSGPLAGASLAFFTIGTLPGGGGNGILDARRATRDPEEGWNSQLFSPSYLQQGNGVGAAQQGISSDQLYSFWTFGAATPEGAFPPGRYLRTPSGSPEPEPNCAVEAEPQGRFEWIGCGSLGTAPKAEGRYISPGGTHVIFTTASADPSTPVQLEPGAPLAPVVAIYDRTPGGPTHVVSLLPGEVTPASEATYQGASADGSAVVFTVAGTLYLRVNDAETLEVAPAGSFAGVSEDGKRVFYEHGGDIYVFDAEGPTTAAIASSAKFVDISADGSHAYFTSGGNLYLWDDEGTHFVAALDPEDLRQSPFVRFPGTGIVDHVALDSWTADCVNPTVSGAFGRAACPSRTSPDGRFLVFQSHADLTPPYKGQKHSEIYRYDAADGSLTCVSCDPSGAPATAESDLQSFTSGPSVATTLIPNITEDGTEVFFQTAAQLLPEDANSVLDVYEWQARGTGGCTRPSGCLFLISSGQGSAPSFLYSMTPDGHDVFFSTQEKLIASDVPSSPSLYDARVEGGFPQPHEPEPCHGDACQGEGTPAPSRPVVHSDDPSSGNGARAVCPRGKRRVKGRCVTAHHHKRHRRANHHRRAAR